MPTFVVHGNKEHWYYLLSLKKISFSTFEIGCRLSISPQISGATPIKFLKSRPKLLHCSIASNFYYEVSFWAISLTWNFYCDKNLPIRGVLQEKKLCDAHDCCISLATEESRVSWTFPSISTLFAEVRD